MTDTVKVGRAGTLMVAHRGASAHECENTCAAFVAAGNRSYFGIETDVWRTADGRFVLLHDGNLRRVGGDDMCVEKCTFNTVRGARLFDKTGVRRGDLCVPELSEYVRICAGYGKVGVLELKSEFTDDEISSIINIIRENGSLEGIIFISFSYANLIRVRSLLPEQPCQFLTVEFTDEQTALLRRDRMDVDIVHGVLTEERIRAFHDAGVRVNCWTVDDLARAAELISWGVDMLTTNALE